MKPLNTDMNAQRWAKEFVELHGGDEDLMRSWFANAIMCGWDNYYWSTDEYKQTIKQTAELQKCIIDPVYFINNYVKTVTIDKGLTDFKLYPYQEKLINKYRNNRFNICKSSRLAGKTLTGIGFLLWSATFNDNISIALCAGRSATARSILEKLQDAYDNLPNWLKMGVTKRNKSELELQNGSRIIAGNTSYDTFKDWSFDLVYLDEFAFAPDKDAQDFVDAVIPAIAANKTSKIIISSTPSYSYKLKNILDEEGNNQTITVQNPFHKIWKDSEDGKNQFVRTLINWDEIPGRNNERKEKMIANIGIGAWNQEFECKFLGS
jgi:hypothetical protein